MADRSKLDMSLDAIIAKEGVPSTALWDNARKGSKPSGSLNNVVFKVGQTFGGKRKADQTLDESMSASGKVSHFGPDSGQVFVENLKFEVNDEDIQQLFSTFGPLKRAAVNYQKDGRSAGTAFVVFENKSDAVNAAESLEGIALDGRPLHLTVVDVSCSTTLRNGGDMTSRVKRQTKQVTGTSRQMWSDIAKKYDDAPKETNRGFQKWTNKNNDKNKEKEEINPDDLDADLDSYLAQRNKS